MARRGCHSVTTSTSVVTSGPTPVTHSNSVPTPARRLLRNRIDLASRIHSTWPSMRLTWDHTAEGGASIVMHVRMRTAYPWWAASRRSRAATSGGTVFTRMPVPCSNPAGTVMRVCTSTYQWNDRGLASGGAVCTTRL